MDSAHAHLSTKGKEIPGIIMMTRPRQNQRLKYMVWLPPFNRYSTSSTDLLVIIMQRIQNNVNFDSAGPIPPAVRLISQWKFVLVSGEGIRCDPRTAEMLDDDG